MADEYIDVMRECVGEKLCLARWWPDGRLLLSFTHPGGSTSVTFEGVHELVYPTVRYTHPHK